MRGIFVIIAVFWTGPAAANDGTTNDAAANETTTAFAARVMPVLSAHCTTCHGLEKPEGKLNLAGPRTPEQLRADAKRWFRVVEQIESGAMPPEGEEPLTLAERGAVLSWVRGELTDWLSSMQLKEGRSKFRRLSRSEYAHTIHDLFGFRPAVIRDLPGDGRVDGYDKVSSALPLSSAGAGGFVKITEDILNRMLKPIPADKDRTYRLWASASEQSQGHILELEDGTMVSFNTDTTSGPLRPKTPDGAWTYPRGTRVPGLHRLRLSVYGYQTDKPLPFGIYAGHTGAYPQLIDLVKVLENAAAGASRADPGDRDLSADTATPTTIWPRYPIIFAWSRSASACRFRRIRWPKIAREIPGLGASSGSMSKNRNYNCRAIAG